MKPSPSLAGSRPDQETTVARYGATATPLLVCLAAELFQHSLELIEIGVMDHQRPLPPAAVQHR
jgi:hypothetical protein